MHFSNAKYIPPQFSMLRHNGEAALPRYGINDYYQRRCSFSICRAFRMRVERARSVWRRVTLLSWKRLAIRISKSASSARSENEETAARIEIYTRYVASGLHKSRARSQKYMASSPTFSRTRLQRERNYVPELQNFMYGISSPKYADRRIRRGRMAPSPPPRELSVSPPSKSTAARRLLAAGLHPLFLP